MGRLTRNLVVSGIPWGTEERDIIDYFEAFGQVLWTEGLEKGPGGTSSSQGDFIIHMANKGAEEQVLSQVHHFGTYWVKVKYPRQQKVRTHRPTEVREHILQDKIRRNDKFKWCKIYSHHKHQEWLIKRGNYPKSKKMITKSEFLDHHGQHAIERRRKEKSRKKREAKLKEKQERYEISRYWDPRRRSPSPCHANCRKEGRDKKKRRKKKRKENKVLREQARSKLRVQFAHQNKTKTAPLNFTALLEKAAANVPKKAMAGKKAQAPAPVFLYADYPKNKKQPA